MSGTDAARPTILLVEDNENIRYAFGILLHESGYRVVEASTGAEALDRVRAERPALVLMDLGLPDMTGLDVTRRIVADPEIRDIPVVALTGRALDADRKACQDAGCAGYLTKPIDTAHLLASIPVYLAGR